MKIFDLELRKPHEQTDLGPSQPPASYGSEDAETSAADARVTADGRPEIVAPPISLRPDREQAFSQNIKPIAIDPADRSSLQAPTFLKRSFSSKLQTNAPKISRREDLVNAIVARVERARSFWQRHLVRDVPSIPTVLRSPGTRGRTFALLTLLVVTICSGALVALTQIKSLQTEIASLKRELLPLRERLARYDQAEKAKEAEIKAAAEKGKALAQNLSQQAPLTFSRNEVQLIREYIKPAPFAGPAAPAVSVGDPVTGGTIPFPSPLTDKVPKLLGARFAIRDGVILIVRKDSRQVDAVLPAH